MMPILSPTRSTSSNENSERQLDLARSSSGEELWPDAILEADTAAPIYGDSYPLGCQALCSPDGRWAVAAGRQRDLFVHDLRRLGAPALPLDVEVPSLVCEGWSNGLADYVSFASRPDRLLVSDRENAVHIFDLAQEATRVLTLPSRQNFEPMLDIIAAMFLPSARYVGGICEQAFGHATGGYPVELSEFPDPGEARPSDSYWDLTGEQVVRRPWPAGAAGAGHVLAGGRWWLTGLKPFGIDMHGSPRAGQGERGAASGNAWRLDGRPATQTVPSTFGLSGGWVGDGSWAVTRDGSRCYLFDMLAEELRCMEFSLPPPTAAADATQPSSANELEKEIASIDARERQGAFAFSQDRQVMFGCFSGVLWRWRLGSMSLPRFSGHFSYAFAYTGDHHDEARQT